MSRFRKKPVEIDAFQFTGDADAVYFWALGFGIEGIDFIWHGDDETLVIPTLEGEMTARLYDWIIRGVEGEFYPCKPHIFRRTYDAIEVIG